MNRLLVILLGLAVQFALPATTTAQVSPPVEVMLLGTYHMDNPGLDEVNVQAADVLTTERQAQIQAALDALARFRPTKVAVEMRREHRNALDSLYRRYVAAGLDESFEIGGFRSRRSEIYQLGFRLAARLDHEGIYPIDHPGEWAFDEVMSFAQKRDTSFVEYFQRWGRQMKSRQDSLQQHATVLEILRRLNAPTSLMQLNAPYARIAAVGEDSTYVGADVVAQWYRRNLRIFANLEDVAVPGERVLVIYGVGHIPILRDLVKASPQMVLVDAVDFI